MQDLLHHLHAYWCLRHEQTILAGFVMKGNRVIIHTSLQLDTLTWWSSRHHHNSPLAKVYWPKFTGHHGWFKRGLSKTWQQEIQNPRTTNRGYASRGNYWQGSGRVPRQTHPGRCCLFLRIPHIWHPEYSSNWCSGSENSDYYKRRGHHKGPDNLPWHPSKWHIAIAGRALL